MIHGQNNLPSIIGRDPPIVVSVLIGVAFVGVAFFFSEWPEIILRTLWGLETKGDCIPRGSSNCIYLHDHIWASVKRVVPGMLIAFIAVLVVLFGSLFRIFSTLLLWLVILLYTIPSTAFYMLLLQQFGFGESTKVMGMLWTGLTLEALFVVYAARGFLYAKGSIAEQWGPIYRQIQTDGVGRARLLWEHMIPLLGPQFAWSFTVVTAVLWKMTIIYEIVGSSTDGLGYLMYSHIHQGNEEVLLAGIAATGMCSGASLLVIYWLARLHERRFFRFKT